MLQPKIYVSAISLVAALGGLLFGFDTVVISGTTERLETLFELDEFWLGFTVSTALIGTIVGAMGVGLSTERVGRRAMLLVTAVLYLVSALGCAFAWSWEALVVFRFIGGLGVGGASVLSPMYIAEISPAKERGRMVALAQFSIVLGILLAFVSNFTIVRLELGVDVWRWMFGVEAAPAFLFGVLLWFIPQSPRWLVSQGRYAEAASVLKRVEGDAIVAQKELEAIRVSFHLEIQSPREPLFQVKYVKVMLLALAITAFNQLSGINAILYYAPKVIKLTGVATSVGTFCDARDQGCSLGRDGSDPWATRR